MEQGKGSVCVTGGTGYVASWLVMRLLQHGYTVRATVRSHQTEGNKKDISYLTSLPGAAERLQIFNADLEVPDSFSPAIEGCTGVFHVAHPIEAGDREEDKALNQKALRGTLGVLRACVSAKTVRRVVYTSSSTAVMVTEAPEDEEVVDESSWSDAELVKKVKPYAASYLMSKVVCERAAMEFAEENGLHLVSLIPSLIGGPFITPQIPGSVRMSMSLIFALHLECLRADHVSLCKPGLCSLSSSDAYVRFRVDFDPPCQSLRWRNSSLTFTRSVGNKSGGGRLGSQDGSSATEDGTQSGVFLTAEMDSDGVVVGFQFVPGEVEAYEFLLRVSLVHIDDVANAFIFLYEHPYAHGRYNCSAIDVTLEDLSNFICRKYPQFQIPSSHDLKDVKGFKPKYLSSKKILDLKFKFKYGLDEIYDDQIKCCRQKGFLKTKNEEASNLTQKSD